MTPELTILVLTAAWTFVLVEVHALGRLQTAGMEWGLGNRDTVPETAAWVGRAERARLNMYENLPLFTILVVVAHLAGVHNGLTVAGATLFLVCRVLHGVLYIAGVTNLRTAVYWGSLIGMGMILLQMF